MMATHSFRLVLDRPPNSAEQDTLAMACDDAGFETGGPDSGFAAVAEFDRAGTALAHAIASAVHDIETAGLRVLGVQPVDLVDENGIAARVDMPRWLYERQIEASTVPHSKPMVVKPPAGSLQHRTWADAHQFYSWAEVQQWLTAHGVPSLYDTTIAAADTLVRQTAARSVHSLRLSISKEVDWERRWRMPDWMKPYCSYIANTGATEPNTPGLIEDLRFRLDYEENLAFTNIVVLTMASTVRAQTDLLERLYTSGHLRPLIHPGEW